MRDRIRNEYFDWLYDKVCKDRFSEHISYRNLFMQLHNTEFVYSIPKDENRAGDGLRLRYRFSLVFDYDDIEIYLNEPCSVLEMIIALAIRCEEDIMDNPEYGDRTGQWFWRMMASLGLTSMCDNHYDRDYVNTVIDIFLNREYEPNGKGGLFTIKNCDQDLRDVEIWYQLCWFIDSIT